MRLVPAVPTSSARRAAAVLGGRTAGWIAALLGLSFSVHTPTAAAQTAAPAAKQAGKDKPAPLPPAPARLWLIAPGPTGPWTLRLDNEGDRPMRIAADARLLQFEIETTEVPAKGKPRRKTTKCSAPASMRPSAFPERRALLLPPGHSYIEQIDPHRRSGRASRRRGRSWWSPPTIRRRSRRPAGSPRPPSC
jgi:hypothetical protein